MKILLIAIGLIVLIILALGGLGLVLVLFGDPDQDKMQFPLFTKKR